MLLIGGIGALLPPPQQQRHDVGINRDLIFGIRRLCGFHVQPGNRSTHHQNTPVHVQIRPLQSQKLAWSQAKATRECHHDLQPKIRIGNERLELLRRKDLLFPHPLTNTPNFDQQNRVLLERQKAHFIANLRSDSASTSSTSFKPKQPFCQRIDPMANRLTGDKLSRGLSAGQRRQGSILLLR